MITTNPISTQNVLLLVYYDSNSKYSIQKCYVFFGSIDFFF